MQQTELGRRIKYFNRKEKTQKCIKLVFRWQSTKIFTLQNSTLVFDIWRQNWFLFNLSRMKRCQVRCMNVWFLQFRKCHDLRDSAGRSFRSKNCNISMILYFQRFQIEFLLKSSGCTAPTCIKINLVQIWIWLSKEMQIQLFTMYTYSCQ